jgi:MFS family permease
MTALMMLLMVGVTGRLIARFGTKPLIVTGLVVLAGGLGVLSTVRAHGSFLADVLPGSLIAAVGMALVFIPATMAAIGAVPPEQGGLASGIVNTTYQIGSAVGLAVMTAIATSKGASRLGDLHSLTNGFQAAFVGAGIVALVGAVLGLISLRTPRPAPAPEPETINA